MGIIVMDKEMRMCVDPGGNGATMDEGEKGGPVRLAGDKIGSQLPTVEPGRRPRDPRR
jgi:hypothetical protein